MNIFHTLSQGKGSINEENISSFLAFLLNPNESHGLNYIFLYSFLDLIFDNLDTTSDSTQENDKIKIALKNAKFDRILLEKSSEYDKDSNIDITITFKDGNEKEYRICIENKINIKSQKENQLENEYENIKKHNKDSTIFMVYLTPQDDKASEYFANLQVRDNDKKAHIFWDGNKGVIHSIKNILDLESSFEIPLISEYVKYTIKSFCYYILDKQVRKYKFVLNDKIYILIAHSSGTIKLYENNKDIKARSILREFLRANDKDYQYNKDDTTRTLGKKVVKILESRL